MWHRYSHELREVFLCAAARAAAMEERDLGSAHVLWALANDIDSPPAKILGRLGVTNHALEAVLGESVGSEDKSGSREPQITPSLRRALDQAYGLAAEIGDAYIGGEHLFLALTREPESTAGGRALARLGVTYENAGHILLAQQTWRGRALPDLPFPGQPFRRIKRIGQWLRWRFSRIAHVTANLNQPFLPYVLWPERIKADPYNVYSRLRRTPFYRDSLIDQWVITGYDHVSSALAEPRFSNRTHDSTALSQEKLPPLVERECRQLESAVNRQMLFRDGADQAKSRSLVARKFTPAVIAHMRGQIQQVTEELLDKAARRGEMDVISDFAVPLPMAIIMRMMGVEEGDRAQFKRWSLSYIDYIAGNTTLAQDLEAYRSVQEFTRYFQAIIRERRRVPGDDLVSLLLREDEQSCSLSEEEVIANCLLLLAGGHENTTRLIGNGILALLREPEKLARLREDKSLLEPAVEELLRYDSPVQWTVRIANEDFEWQGHAIKHGQRILLGLASANRDPAQFTDPDKLDLARSPNRHLAFGNGPHFCLGSALTRLEGQIALGALLARFPNIRLAGDPVRAAGNFTFRGLQSLKVLLD